VSDTTGSRPSVWPTFRCRDAERELRFLVEAFGFEEIFVVRGEDRPIEHAELRWPLGGGVMFGSVLPDDAVVTGGVDLPDGPVSIYVVTDAPDALFARARAAGAEIVGELHDTDYGSRDFTARDPEGNVWVFGTYAGGG
jgi:uncharacterized glyoxalase superfamily protein PhnB